MVEILKQNQYVPMNIDKQVAIIYAGSKGYLDDLEIEKVLEFESGLFEYLDANASSALSSITMEGLISDETEKLLDKAINDYKQAYITE